MQIDIIEGKIKSDIAIDLLTEMTKMSIRFQEKMITADSSEEEINFRENKIMKLQSQLGELRDQLAAGKDRIDMDAFIKLHS
ncbi:MAG: hypothetical protein ACK4E0_10650 [Chitinophagaceae bacterium]